MSTAQNAGQQAKAEIDAHIQQNGGVYSDWYVGIAAYPRSRLFDDHNVSEQNGKYIARDCGTESAARLVEKYFLLKGCQGGGGGGNANTTYAYAYKITASTVE